MDPTRSSADAAGLAGDVPWWHEAVVYQVYPRSFADGNGDGIGDLAGVRARLPYLADLGVDAIWLSPFYPSPLRDGGYDVADYMDVDPRLGTLADFDALVAGAGARGIRVVVDIVPNHCSVDHPVFQEALAAGPGSPRRDPFIFRDGRAGGPPNNWESAFGGPAWTRVRDGQWYLHLYDSSQPDWNWRSPWVAAMFEGVLRFWLDRGVAGFRVDVAHGLFKDPALPDVPDAAHSNRVSAYYHRPELVEHYRSWRAVLDSYSGDRTAVGEVWVVDPADWRPYIDPAGLPQLLNFLLLDAPWDAGRFRTAIDTALVAAGPAPTWVLGSHDAVRQVSRFGLVEPAPGVTLQPGSSLGPGAVVDLARGTRRARAAALLLLALPGSPYVYQGDELGLPEVIDLPVRHDPMFRRSGGRHLGRDGCRVPVPWSGATPPYGWVRPWLPQPGGWAGLTVEAQSADAGSTLSLHRAATAIRRAHPALGAGSLRWLDAPPGCLLLARDPGFACAVNMGDTAAPLPPHVEVLLTSGPLDGALLPPDTAAWLTDRR
jgi:glycosidase